MERQQVKSHEINMQSTEVVLKLKRSVSQKIQEGIKLLDQQNKQLQKLFQQYFLSPNKEYSENINTYQNDFLVKLFGQIQSCDSSQVYFKGLFDITNINAWFIISSINFPNLLQLYIIQLDVYNIECIQWLNSPNLKKLRIQSTAVNSIKSLAKVNFKQLKKIHFSLNKKEQTQLCHLSRMKTTNAQYLVFSLNRDDQQQLIYTSYNFLKIQSHKIYTTMATTKLLSNSLIQRFKHKFILSKQPIVIKKGKREIINSFYINLVQWEDSQKKQEDLYNFYLKCIFNFQYIILIQILLLQQNLIQFIVFCCINCFSDQIRMQSKSIDSFILLLFLSPIYCKHQFTECYSNSKHFSSPRCTIQYQQCSSSQEKQQWETFKMKSCQHQYCTKTDIDNFCLNWDTQLLSQNQCTQTCCGKPQYKVFTNETFSQCIQYNDSVQASNIMILVIILCVSFGIPAIIIVACFTPCCYKKFTKWQVERFFRKKKRTNQTNDKLIQKQYIILSSQNAAVAAGVQF